jgi:hypothetical protein
MRSYDDLQEGMFSYISPEKRVPTDHPLRPIRNVGRPSIAPERLLRVLAEIDAL